MMQSESGNDVKQYNLTAGKSLPEWLDERKRRTLLKRDVELRRRLELLQDFDMPSVSNNIKISKDGDYILSTGTYKPRIKCFDVTQLGLKFERCFDSETVAFEMLSDDYSKCVFLQCDRYIELHAQFGKYYRFRVPKFGRDLAYNPVNCDCYVVGAGSDVHRLNLEQGRFLQPFTTQSLGLNVCKVNPEHQLMVCGSNEGRIEAWDPRSRQRAATLDSAFSLIQGDHLESNDQIPQITSLAFRDGLNMGVGTSTGHILLYDIRSSRPLLVKDHYYGIPIKKLFFHSTLDQVVSLDAKSVKIWDRATGKPYTSIESENAELNDICAYEGSGLIFMANEQPKMQVHYIPSLGPAPRWCAFLDNITEEIEESSVSSVYDDYKFVTKDELTDLGLDHLIGTSLLRAYMHGYFMDARLYRKAHSVAAPYTLDKFMRDKINGKLAEERSKRVQHKTEKLPKTNKDLFLKLKENEENGVKKKHREAAANLLKDDRFSAMFTNENFQVDQNDQAFKLLNPVLTKLDAKKAKQLENKYSNPDISDNDQDEQDSDNFVDDENDSSDESSDDDAETTKQIKQAHKKIQQEVYEKKQEERAEKFTSRIKKTIKKTSSDTGQHAHEFRELNEDEMNSEGKSSKRKSKKSLAERLEEDNRFTERQDGHQMVFKPKKSRNQLMQEEKDKEHRKERQELRRSASGLKKDKIKPKFWKGKRII